MNMSVPDRIEQLLRDHRLCRDEGHPCAVYEAAYLALRAIGIGAVVAVVCEKHDQDARCYDCATDDELVAALSDLWHDNGACGPAGRATRCWEWWTGAWAREAAAFLKLTKPASADIDGSEVSG